MKLNAKARKELAKFAPAVAVKIDEYASRYHTRSVFFQQHPAGWNFYLNEATTYTIFAPNGKVSTTAMIGEHTIGAANDGMNYLVGKDTPGLPEGTWVVEFQLFLGKPFITAHYVGLAQIGVSA